MNKITAVILAAGKGTRMKSRMAKVLHEVFFRPMLHHVLDAVTNTDIHDLVVIVGHQRSRVIDSLTGYRFTAVTQEEQLGTGHAVLCAEEACADADTVLILCGDTPLIRSHTLADMISHHRSMHSSLTLMTTMINDPFGYGRIITNDNGQVVQIVEEKDADDEQRRIREINAGIYLADRNFLFDALRRVGTDNSQGEVYLTDIVTIANSMGQSVNRFTHGEPLNVLGVNSRVELAQAHREIQDRRNTALMLSGVTMYGPESIFIADNIPVGPDTVIHPGVQVTGNTAIGEGCLIGPGVFLHDCEIGNNAVIGAHSILHSWQVQPSEYIFARTIRAEDEGPPEPDSRCRK